MLMKRGFIMRAYERLLNYVVVRTPSDEHSTTSPSSQCQFDLARILADEMTALGISDVSLDEFCYVYGKIPATPGYENKPSIGFIAHMDTVSDYCDHDIIPVVHKNYDGSDLPLGTSGRTLTVKDFPHLPSLAGCTLITTDGTTVLGADDKAGVAEIMTMAEALIKENIPHGPISIAFTPDEEVSGLAKDLDLERFKSPIAYTLDGDHLGYYMDETFNASLSTIEIHGISVHTATAKGIMKNAVDIGNAFLNKLPALEKPQYTQGREGFYHVVSFNGDCEYAKIEINVRDHDSLQFDIRNNTLKMIVDMLNEEYGQGTVNITQRIQYRNLKEVIDQVPFMIPYLKQAIESVGLTPQTEPFRGGTDGSALSHRGLPCPNLSAGYENAHGRFEYVPIQSMEKNVEILLNLIDIYAKCDC